MRTFTVAALLGLVGLLSTVWAQAEPVDFTLPDVHGETQHLSQYRGQWVVVNFWATWCAPCLAEIPDLQAFHDAHQGKGAVVVGINMESIERDRLRDFVKEHTIGYPVWHMEPAVETALGKVFGLPTTFMVNPQGEVVAREMGAVTGAEIEDFIRRYEAGAAKEAP
jgi:thiol-disulfide isomerase/thioredoxin